MAFYYVGGIPFDDHHSLMHYKTPGAKNGVRRYQNKDGSLTPLGRIHYGVGQAREGISNAYTSTKKKVTNAYNSGKEYLTGSNARKKLQYAKQHSGNHAANEASNLYRYANEQRALANKYRSAVSTNTNSAAVLSSKKRLDALNSATNRYDNAANKYKSIADAKHAEKNRFLDKSNKFASAAAKNANTAKLNSKETKDMAGNVYPANRGKVSNAERQRERNELMSEKMYGKAMTSRNETNSAYKKYTDNSKKADSLRKSASAEKENLRSQLRKRSNTLYSNYRNQAAANRYETSASRADKTANYLTVQAAGKQRTLQEAQRAYDRTLPGQIDRLKESFNTTYNNVVKYVKETAEELYGKASKYYKETVSSITTGGKKAIEKAKKFLASIFG